MKMGVIPNIESGPIHTVKPTQSPLSLADPKVGKSPIFKLNLACYIYWTMPDPKVLLKSKYWAKPNPFIEPGQIRTLSQVQTNIGGGTIPTLSMPNIQIGPDKIFKLNLAHYSLQASSLTSCLVTDNHLVRLYNNYLECPKEPSKLWKIIYWILDKANFLFYLNLFKCLFINFVKVSVWL